MGRMKDEAIREANEAREASITSIAEAIIVVAFLALIAFGLWIFFGR